MIKKTIKDPNINELIDAFEKVAGYHLSASMYHSTHNACWDWPKGKVETSGPSTLTISWLWSNGYLEVTVTKD